MSRRRSYLREDVVATLQISPVIAWLSIRLCANEKEKVSAVTENSHSKRESFTIENPLVVMFRMYDGKICCHIMSTKGETFQGYALLACDLVRHVAAAFKVEEDDVWEWVDKERHHKTTEIEIPS